ncbi:hypothetical protein FBU30_008370 [Linnemannia zychae]|nr:hypothetical protein FBU30_008370 [Linnemannia zychae]
MRSLAVSPTTKVLDDTMGPNRPWLKHFSFTGTVTGEWLMDLVLFNLLPSTLTTLELNILNSGIAKDYLVDVERILETYSNLKALCLEGSRFRYNCLKPLSRDDNSLEISKEQPVSTTTYLPTQYRLESLSFEPRHMTEDFEFFRRLGNLKRIQVKHMPATANAMNWRPWAFGRAMRKYCSKLESIEIQGPIPLWLYDLPVLPYDKIPHITSLAEQSPAYMSMLPADIAQAMKEDRLILQLLDQEQEELIEGKTAKPFFPLLRRLVLREEHVFSFQDLLSLGVQALFLTHLDISHPSSGKNEPWSMYEHDENGEAVPGGTTTPYLSTASPKTIEIIEDKRLQKRKAFNNRELLLFLQLCSSLKYLSLLGCQIAFENLVEESIADFGYSTVDDAPIIHPWACEGSLEILKLGLDISQKQPKEDHAIIWKHLGRFRRLRSLTLESTHARRWTLMPTFKHGVEGLFEEDGGIRETLEELQIMPGWWFSEEGRRTVLWFAKSCPKLRKLVLEYNFRFAAPEDNFYGFGHDDFMEDEEVKRCSISQIVVRTISA